MQRIRNKIVDKKRLQGIELEETEYFQIAKNKKRHFVSNWSKRLRDALGKNKKNVVNLFNFGKLKEGNEDSDSDSDDENKKGK
jgi:hypothetical protein